jgi:hypothetical protein
MSSLLDSVSLSEFHIEVSGSCHPTQLAEGVSLRGGVLQEGKEGGKNLNPGGGEVNRLGGHFFFLV